MTSSVAPFLSPCDAARRLGVSIKALRLYERHGLILPHRNEAGWRAYGPEQMARARQVVALRALGLGLEAVAQAMRDEGPQHLASTLAAHQALLETRMRNLAAMLDDVRSRRALLEPRAVPPAARLSFDLPWPWGGETFTLDDIPPLTWIIGPLGSGKTRLAMRLAEHLPQALFVGLEREDPEGHSLLDHLDADAALRTRVAATVGELVAAGATRTPALGALVAALETEGPANLVLDLVEQGLDRATQEALAGLLRRRAALEGARPIFMLTRSSSMLDLAAVGPHEAILLCPANHSPPVRVAPYPGTPGYEAVATCLATPEVRARTQGVVVPYRRAA